MSTEIARQYGDSTCARILCVGDDVVQLLDIELQLDGDHDFVIVTTIEEGDAALACEPPFDLILSGPRMRDISAVPFMQRLHAHSPDAERIILAPPGDCNALEMATHDARVMRVLLNPCPANLLREAVYDALLRHRARVLRAQFGHQITPRSTAIGHIEPAYDAGGRKAS